MSHPSRSRSGLGKAEAAPGRRGKASASTDGPPGCASPRSFAVLSKASPGASSMVPPSRTEAVNALNQQELAMPARDQQHDVRKGNSVGQPRRQGMTRQMVHRPPAAGPWPPPAPRASITPERTPSDQPRPRRHRNPVDLVQRDPGQGQRLLDHTIQPLGMGSRGNLGHHSTERPHASAVWPKHLR